MTALRLVQALTALLAVTCIAFGYGKAWFVVGFFAGIVSATLWGLLAKLREDPTQMASHREAEWRRRHDEADEDQLPYKPAEHRPYWDNEMGSIE